MVEQQFLLRVKPFAGIISNYKYGSKLLKLIATKPYNTENYLGCVQKRESRPVMVKAIIKINNQE